MPEERLLASMASGCPTQPGSADRVFLAAHAGPTIFLAMRFDESPVLDAIANAARRAGRESGYDVIRADDRDYTGDLWGT